MKKSLIYFFFFLVAHTFAYHIVGGELFYDQLSGNNYRITLKLYRDCTPGRAGFDGTDPGSNIPPAVITVFDGANGLVTKTLDIGAPAVTHVPPTINSPCIQAPNTICVEEGIYTYTTSLPPKTGGYYLVYQRCCRNSSINNLANPDNQGSTYYTKIPGPEDAPSNSSPRFQHFPPIFICNNLQFPFNHAATDPDGDSLVYSLCAPFLGCSFACPSLASGTACPTTAAPLPYSNVNYSGSYSGSYPIPSNPAFSINPATGQLTGKPNLIGQFVVGVRVQEFRGGKLINTHYRDFQFNVISCVVQVVSAMADQTRRCMGNTIDFVNQSFGSVPLNYFWDFGIPGVSSDTSDLASPSFTFPDTGQYVVTLIANPGSPCTDTLKKTFNIYPNLQSNFAKEDAQCLKGNSFTFTNTGIYFNTATYNWNFTSAATPSISTLKNPSGIVFNQPGKFYVKLIGKQLSCIDSIIDTVRVLGPPVAKIDNLGTSLCDPARVGFSNGTTSELPVSFSWQFSNGLSSTDFQPVQVFSPPGIYGVTLTAISMGICVDTSMFSIQNLTVNPKPKADFNLTPTVTTIFDPEITFTNNSGNDVHSCTYYFGDGNSMSAFNCIYPYQKPGKYFVTQIVSNSFNCSDTIIKEVIINPEFRFWIPNTFTPNNDGMNDVFMPKAVGVLNYQFDIYNKWGEHIYSGNDYEQGWDGRFKGKSCEQDVYVWKIGFKNVITQAHEVHFGHVLLLRVQD